MDLIIYSDSVSSIMDPADSIDISFGSSSNKISKKPLAMPVDSINEFIKFMNIDRYICSQCDTKTIKTFNSYCIDCSDYNIHNNKFKKIINNMFVCVDKYKNSCRYQLNKYIKRYSNIDIKYSSIQDNITFQIKKHIIVYILKQLLQITRKNKVYVLLVCIDKCYNILCSDNTVLWLSIKDQDINRQSMINNMTYFSFHKVFIIKNNIYVVLKYKKIDGYIYNVCFINDNIYIPKLDDVSILIYKKKGYNCSINCLLVHLYIYCINVNSKFK